jgi:hypothetical protein
LQRSACGQGQEADEQEQQQEDTACERLGEQRRWHRVCNDRRCWA